MATMLVPRWVDSDGTQTGMTAEVYRTQREAEERVLWWMQRATTRRLKDFRILTVDDVTWRRGPTIRPKGTQ